MSWLEAFVLTLALEQPVYLLFLRKRFESWWAPSAFTVFVNLLTHPLLWFCLKQADPDVLDLKTVLVAEAVVVFVEGLALWLILRRRMKTRPAAGLALAASLAANATSFLGGLAISAYWR